MRLEHLPAEFKVAAPILETIEAAGYEAYFVGGCVRDTILGKPLHDVDIATSAFPAEIKGLFKRTVDTGIEHGTVMILDHGNGYETTTFRTESTYQDYRRPDQVQFVRSLSEDLQRRDFTINALAMRVNGEIIDLFAGLDDLQRRIIRAVGAPEERFHEDALRMMRAVRFASQLDFTIEQHTEQAIHHHAQLLTKIAVERTQVEWEKLLLGQQPAKGLQALLTAGLDQYLPGFAHQHAALQQLMTVLTNEHLTQNTEAWVLQTWLCDLHGDQLRDFGKQWKLSNQLIGEMMAADQVLTSLHSQRPLTAAELFDAGLPALQTADRVAELLGFGQPLAELTTAYQNLPIKSTRELAINGGDLIKQQVVRPGPQMGQILNQLVQQVLAQKVTNQSADLMALARMLADSG